MIRPPPRSPLFPYTTLFRSDHRYLPHGDLLTFEEITRVAKVFVRQGVQKVRLTGGEPLLRKGLEALIGMLATIEVDPDVDRSEEHTSELQSPCNLVCRLLLE